MVVQSVTTVPVSAAQSRHHREIQYIIAMSIRTACLLTAVFTLPVIPWLGWVTLAAAIALPYFAVVLANTGAVGASTPVMLEQPGSKTILEIRA